MSQSQFIEGTASELIRINGAAVEPVGFSIMAKHKLVTIVGKAPKVQGKTGKQGSIYRVTAVPGFVEFTAD